MKEGIITRDELLQAFDGDANVFASAARSLKAASVPLPWLRRVPGEIAEAQKIAGDIWQAWRDAGLVQRVQRDEYVMNTTEAIGLKDTSKSTIVSTDPSARGPRANEAAIEQVVPHVYISSTFSMLPRDMVAGRVFNRDAAPSSFADVAQDMLDRIDRLILNGAGVSVTDPATKATAVAEGVANNSAPLSSRAAASPAAWDPATYDAQGVFNDINTAVHDLRKPSRTDSNIDSEIVLRGRIDILVPQDKAELFDRDYSTATSTVTTLAQRIESSRMNVRLIFTPLLSGKVVLYPQNRSLVRMITGFGPITLPENRPFNFTQSRDFVMIGGMVPAVLKHPKLNSKAAIIEITGI